MCKPLLKTLLALTLLATSIVAASTVTAREHSLLELATTVTTTDGWDAHCHHTFGWYWLSDQEVLFARNNEGAGPTIYYKRNVVTGKETKLSALSKALNGVRNEDGIDISPNNKWALVHNRHTQITALVALNGSRHFAMPYKGWFLTWLPDSRHFLTVEGDAGPQRAHAVSLHDIYHPSSVAPKTLYSSLPVQDLDGLWHSGNHFLIACADDDKANRVTIYRYGYDRRTSANHNLTVPLPKGAEIEKVLLSPHANRLAYVLDVKKAVRPPARTVKRTLVNLPTTKECMEVWVSDIQGHHLHRIGSIAKDQADTKALYFPLGVEWLPSGKAICVDYRWTLYTIPVK